MTVNDRVFVNRNDLFFNRKRLAQTLLGLSERQLDKFRLRFPTPISDDQIEDALRLALGYPPTDPDPRHTSTPCSIQQETQPKKKIKIR